MKLAGTIVGWGVAFLCIVLPGLYLYTRFFR